jgi:hypothetical protein
MSRSDAYPALPEIADQLNNLDKSSPILSMECVRTGSGDARELSMLVDEASFL